MILTTGGVNKNIETKGNFADCHGRNISRHLYTLSNFLLTKSERKRHY